MTPTTSKIRPVLQAMQPGDTQVFPIERLKTVRTQASELGAIYDRVYTTTTDRVERTIEVKRVS